MIHFNIIILSTPRSLQLSFPFKFLIDFSSSPYAPHALSIQSSLTEFSEQHLMRSKNREDFHHAIVNAITT